MRKVLFLALVLLVNAAWVMAQTTGSSSSSTGTSSQSTRGTTQPGSSSQGSMSSQSGIASESGTAGSQTIQGCLQGASGNFTLVDKTGKTYQLQGETAQLSNYIGQEVSVRGIPVTSSSSSAGMSPSSSSASASQSTGASASSSTTSPASATGTAATLTVSHVSKISDTCSPDSSK